MEKVAVVTKASDLKNGAWFRLHPLTPILKGGLILGGLIGIFFASIWQMALDRGLSTVFGTQRDQGVGEFFMLILKNPGVAVSVFFFAVFATALVVTLQWRAHCLRITTEVIEVRKGILFRNSRRARLDRVNTVGMRRPLLPRLFGLARLDIQAAGSDAGLILAYLPQTVASDLRSEILKDSITSPEPDSVKESWRDVEVPLFRYLVSLLLGAEAMTFIFIFTAGVFLATTLGRLVVWVLPIAILIGYIGFLATRLTKLGNFSVRSSGGELQVSFGLITTSVETIPPSKVHALQISQPWIWRFFGWWKVNVNLASISRSSREKTPDHTLIIPVATTSEMEAVLKLCLPRLDSAGALNKIMTMLLETKYSWRDAELMSGALIRPPTRAKFRIPLTQSVTGGAILPGLIVLRTGRLVARLSVFPLSRIQSSSIATGPWLRALGLVYFSVDTVGGPVVTSLKGLDSSAAHSWWEKVNSALDAVRQESSSAREK